MEVDKGGTIYIRRQVTRSCRKLQCHSRKINGNLTPGNVRRFQNYPKCYKDLPVIDHAEEGSFEICRMLMALSCFPADLFSPSDHGFPIGMAAEFEESIR